MNETVRFRQRNLLTKVSLVLHPAHLEYAIKGEVGTGLNVKYEQLPRPFDRCTYRAPDMLVLFPVYIVSVLTLVHLFTDKKVDAKILPFMAVYAGLLALGGYAVRRFVKKAYTALPVHGTQGRVLIVRDRQHDKILEALEERRLKGLAKFAAADPLAPPRQELKKLRWLKEEGALAEEDFAAREKQLMEAIAAAPGAGSAPPPGNLLH